MVQEAQLGADLQLGCRDEEPRGPIGRLGALDGELATLRAIGWSDRTLGRLVATEGVGMGVAGAVVGALLGLAGAAAFARAVPTSLLLVAAVAGLLGVGLSAAASVAAALALRRLSTPVLLAEE